MPSFEIITNQGVEEMDINVKDMLSGMFGQQKKKRKMTVSEAFDYLIQEEENRLIDMDQVTRVAVDRVEQMGILFIDEIDKIAGRESGHGPDVSREGVQRDILPIVEGTTVNTRYGMVRTDHILFIAAGAFHTTKPSDLIPELQGRFPIRVELSSLSEADFIRILTEPKNALIKQYIALLDTEGLKLSFSDDAIAAIARFAATRQRAHRKHRRAPPAHHSRKSARGNFLRGARNEEENGEAGRRLRPKAASGHRERSRSKPLHSLRNGKSPWDRQSPDGSSGAQSDRRLCTNPRQDAAPHLVLRRLLAQYRGHRLRRPRRSLRAQAPHSHGRHRSLRRAGRKRGCSNLFAAPAGGRQAPLAATALRSKSTAALPKRPRRAATTLVTVGGQLLVTIPAARVDSYVAQGHFRYTDSFTAQDFAQQPDSTASYAVRTSVSEKKLSEMSNVVTLRIYPAAVPIADLKTEVTHPAIVLTWTPPDKALSGSAPSIIVYHIYRGTTDVSAPAAGARAPS